MTRTAFTLLELTVVLLVLAVAASAVALKVAAPMKAANMADACRRVRQFDELTRSYCRAQDRPAVMEIAADGKGIRRLDAAGGPIGGECELGNDLTITAVLAAGAETHPDGAVRVACSSRGFTPTYAVLIEGPNRHRRWLLFAGLTGDVTETTDDAQVRELLENTCVEPNPKSEFRIPESETINNDQNNNDRMPGRGPAFRAGRLEHWDLAHWRLFRVSRFVLRDWDV